VIAGIVQFQQMMMWALDTAAGVALLLLLLVRKNYRVYPAFTFYISVNIAFAASLFIVYRHWGFSSLVSWRIGWATQAVTVCARGWAVIEISRRFLSRYPGIWALAQRVLLTCGGVVLLYSGMAVRHQWKLALPTVDRALELAIAAVLVVLFLFARFYDLGPERTDRSLALGLCLYSCFRVLNDTISDRYLYHYATVWNLLGMLAFFASSLLWIWALRKSQPERAAEEKLLPLGVYQSFAPQINLRLQLLNDQVNRILSSEGPRH
jgi:hypothetical protein